MMRSLIVLLLLSGCHPSPGPTTPTRQAKPASPGVKVDAASSQPASGPASVPASQPAKVRPPLLPTGSLDPQQIQETIARHAAQVRRCHQQKSERRPPRRGNMRVRLVIDAEGGVRAVRIEESTLNEPAVARCLLAAIKGWTFPKPRGGEVVVQTPLEFGK